MTDYSSHVEITRSAMASMLTENDEQFVWVLTEALVGMSEADFAGVLGYIQWGYDAEDSPDLVIERLKQLTKELEENLP